MSTKLHGIISAMVTPFTRGGEFVDFDKIGPIAAHLVKQGAGGLFVCGTTGEGMLLSSDERKEVLEEVIATVGKKTAVVAHTGALDTATSIELTLHAAEAGAQCAAVVAPGYYAYDDASLKTFYRDVAKAADGFPILLYNIPGCARNALSAELVLELAEIDNIVGMKDSSGSMIYLTRIIGNAPRSFQVINGADEYGFQAFVSGTDAAVSGTSNVVVDIYNKVYQNVKKGNLKKAWAEQVKLEQACRIFEYGRMISIFKEGMRLKGVDAGFVRPPQRELSAAEKRNLAKAMESAGLL